MQEIEVKILSVDERSICDRLNFLGANKVQDTKLTVDWFRHAGIDENSSLWFLRIRTNSSGKSEITWKSRPETVGIARKVREINLAIVDQKSMVELFEAIGLEKYAHQEKFRKSWVLQNWRLDMDQYPGMPAYLEIEGQDERHIKKAMLLLGLEKHQTSSEGERVLIQKEYGLDWYNMKF